MVPEAAQTDTALVGVAIGPVSSRPTVAVIKTSPETVISDIGSCMRLAGYE